MYFFKDEQPQATDNVVKSTEEEKIQDTTENAEEIQKSIEIVRMDTPTIEYTQPSDGDDSDENSQKSLVKEIPVVKTEDVSDTVSKKILFFTICKYKLLY